MNFLLALALLVHDEEDPVCHMKVPIENARWTFDYAGKKYYF
jgi:YHS domain-containing protein